MATKSEKVRAEELRLRAAANTRAATVEAPANATEPHENEHAARKATYAMEEGVIGRPSRKSTRKSANRAKPDAGLTIREQLQKGTPEARYLRSKAQAHGKHVA